MKHKKEPVKKYEGPAPLEILGKNFYSKIFTKMRHINRIVVFFRKKKAAYQQPQFLTGFTLLETIVAISVLVFATIGPMTLAADSIRNASLFRNQTVAYFLAEEAVEYVHNVVDTNSFLGNDWLFGLDPQCTGPDGCIIDVPGDAVIACTGGCGVIRLDSNDGLYSYGPSSPTNIDTVFTRSIFVDENPNDIEVQINVRVSWIQVGQNRQANIEEHLFNWR